MLLTGFEPFGGLGANPSALVAGILAASPPPGMSLHAAVLPTTFAGAGAALHRLVDEARPDAVLMLGLAGGRRGLTVERVAINLRDARIPDNAGDQPVDEPCVPGAPTAYLSTLPVKRMVRAIRAAGIEAAVSHSAGTFICNHVLFEALHRTATGNGAFECAFLHLPFLPEQADAPDAPSLPLAEQVRGVRAALDAVADPAAGKAADEHGEGALW